MLFVLEKVKHPKTMTFEAKLRERALDPVGLAAAAKKLSMSAVCLHCTGQVSWSTGVSKQVTHSFHKTAS